MSFVGNFKDIKEQFQNTSRMQNPIANQNSNDQEFLNGEQQQSEMSFNQSSPDKALSQDFARNGFDISPQQRREPKVNFTEEQSNQFQDQEVNGGGQAQRKQELGLNMDMQIGKTVGTNVQPHQDKLPKKNVQYVKMELALNYIQQMQKDMENMNSQHKYLIDSIQSKFKKIQQESQNYFIECYRDQRTKYKNEIAQLKTDLRDTNQRLQSAIQDYQNSNTAWLKEKNQLAQQNLNLAEKIKRDEMTNDKSNTDNEIHINNLQIAQTKLSDKFKKVVKEKKSIAYQNAVNQQDIIQMTVDSMITQIELQSAKGEQKIVIREVPIQASILPPPPLPEQNSIDQESVDAIPQIKEAVADNFREEAKTPISLAASPVPLPQPEIKVSNQEDFKIEPNQEKFEEAKRQIRMVEFQMNPMKEKLIGMVQKDEKGKLTEQEKDEMEVILVDYQEKLAELKAKQLKTSRFQPIFAIKQDLLQTGDTRRSLDAIGPKANPSKKLQNQNDLLKKDITKILAEKADLASQVQSLRKMKSDWMQSSRADAKSKEEDIQLKAAGAAALSIGKDNEKLTKKIKSLQAEIEQYKNQKNQQEQEKQSILADKVNKEQYLQLQAANSKLTSDIDDLRQQLGKRMTDKKMHDQFQNLQKQNNTISEELAKIRKDKNQISSQLQALTAQLTAVQKQRDHIQKAFDDYQNQTPRKQPAQSIISQQNTNKALESSVIGAGAVVPAAAAAAATAENQEMRKLNQQLQKQLSQVNRDKQAVEVEREQLAKKLDKAQKDLEALGLRLQQSNKGGEKSTKQLRKKLQQLKTETDAKIGELDGQLKEAVKERDQLKEKYQKLQKDKLSSIGGLQKKLTQITEQHDQLTQANNGMTKQIDEMTKSAAKMKDDLQAAKKVAGKADQLKTDLTFATAQVAQLNRHVTQIDQKYKQQVLKRKKLHNELEDMKGKIRVYARVRPVSQKQKDMESPVVVNIPDEFSINVQKKTGIKSFNFDTCFGANSTQEQIFEDTKRLVQSAIDGFNVCVFAYGQTGSGKTFTIQGVQGNPGVAPRAITELFELIGEMNHCQIKIETYMVELYIDDLNDLLLDKKSHPQKLEIKEDPNGMMYVQGVTKKQIYSIEEAEATFAAGLNSRKIAKTNMNSESSRSHLIFSMLIDVRNNATGKKTVGKLSFIDLAGSERLNKTDATSKERINQSKAINGSLSALSNVISKLASGNAKFVPYRDNKLTQLMKDSIGGNAKTLMFVNVSPVEYNASETVQSLEYAMRVKEIKNDVSKNTESLEVARYKQRCRELQMLNDKFKGLLQENDIAFENVPQEDYDIEEVKIGG